MKRYEVRKHLVGVNESGKRISPYGSIPPGFKVIQDGWIVYDNHNNTYGLYSMYSQTRFTGEISKQLIRSAKV